jgi:ubiquinone/menaquinone biosynthesis C-methylase UbiE
MMFPILNNQKRARFFYSFASLIYDFVNPLIYTKGMKKILIDEIEGDRILDVGVGTGYTTKELKNAVGIDISRGMLSKAKKNYRGFLVLADAMCPPFKPESFSTIISTGSLYYLPSPLEGLRIFHLLLKKQGVFLSITPNIRLLKLWVRVYCKTELEKLFNLSGFEIEKIIKIGWKEIAYFSKVRKVG